MFCVSERTLALGAAEEFLEGSGKLESGLSPINLRSVGEVLKGLMVRPCTDKRCTARSLRAAIAREMCGLGVILML